MAEDRTSGYEWISVLHTNQNIAGLWVCFFLCQKCHLLLSYLYLVNSSPQLCLQWSSALSIMVFITAAFLPAPSRLRAPWDEHQTSPGSQETFDEWVNQSGDATKSMPDRTTGIDEVRTLAGFSAPFRNPGSQTLFIIIWNRGQQIFFWKRSDKYFRPCSSLVSVISTQLCFYRVTAAINNR